MQGINRVQEILDNESAAYFVSGYNLRYMSGMPCSDAGTLIVTKNRAYLIIDFRYIEVAKTACFPGVEVILQGKTYEQVKKILDKEGIVQLLLEDSATLEDLNNLMEHFPERSFVTDSTLSDICRECRAVKRQDELDSIIKAQSITDAAFSNILNFIRPGVTELEIAARLEYEMRKLGSEGPAFSTISITGKNTSKPHGVPGNTAVAPGDFVTMDYGAKFAGYCSDMTRTVAVGDISDRQELVYETVLKAHNEVKKKAHAGMIGKDLDFVARDIINKAGFEGKFGHSLGHSLGLFIHEKPMASPTYEGILPAGAIVTDEPGIYLEGEFGVRIENMILLKEDGCEDLTKSPTELIRL